MTDNGTSSLAQSISTEEFKEWSHVKGRWRQTVATFSPRTPLPMFELYGEARFVKEGVRVTLVMVPASFTLPDVQFAEETFHYGTVPTDEALQRAAAELFRSLMAGYADNCKFVGKKVKDIEPYKLDARLTDG